MVPGPCDWGEASKVALASAVKLASHATPSKVGAAGTGINGTFLCQWSLDRVTLGGPLACLRAGGTWTLAIVVSWGVSCARGWDTLKRSITARGSPGIFSQVAAFMDFSTQRMTPGRYEYWEVFFLSCLFSTNRDPNCHATAASLSSTNNSSV